MSEEKNSNPQEEKPPVLKSWKNMYLLVLLNLAATILVFYLITLYFQ